jgi:hypothetical protein
MRRFAAAAGALALLVLGPAPGARAAVKATYVGIVISGHGSGCVKWHSGITGDEILNDIASVHYRRDGLIDQIDGQPSPPHADSTHYWSYWHDTGSSWTYSGTGASGSTPSAGTVEGWSYVNGASSSSPPAQSPGGLYASLCGSKDPRPAASTTHHTSVGKPAPRTTVQHGSLTHRAGSPARPAARSTNGAGSSSSADAAGTGTASARSRTPSGTADVASNGQVGAAAPSATQQPSSIDASPASGSAKSSSGSAIPVILGVALALALGGGAGWTVLRRRRAEAADH